MEENFGKFLIKKIEKFEKRKKFEKSEKKSENLLENSGKLWKFRKLMRKKIGKVSGNFQDYLLGQKVDFF